MQRVFYKGNRNWNRHSSAASGGVRKSARSRSNQKKDLPNAKKLQGRKTVPGLERCYIKVGHRAIRWALEDGRYNWGGRDIHDSGTYTASQPDKFSCIVELASELFKDGRKRCRMTRQGRTYTVKELPNGEEHKFKRDDNELFLAECSAARQPRMPVIADRQRAWKQIEESNARASFFLTGESVIRAATIPAPPSSKNSTVVRVTHSNIYGRIDSDVYVRLGDPKQPLDVEDFDTVSDWRKARLVEDLSWSDEREQWVLWSKAKGDMSAWSGTYDVDIRFPKGHCQIELKIISRVPEVCSIVLSNWKVYVK
jgi:hypothetical protein